jgi:hypothetical protein
MPLSSTTELEAVNIMLRDINEAPIASLSGLSDSSDMGKALNILRQVSREVQSRGWAFNTRTEVALTRDVANKIAIPTGATRVEISTYKYPRVLLVIRNGYLYDNVTGTDVLTQDYTAEKIVFALDFADLPENAKAYITHRASRVFQDRVFGSRELQQTIGEQEQRSWAEMLRDECRVRDVNIFKNPDVLADFRYGYA